MYHRVRPGGLISGLGRSSALPGRSADNESQNHGPNSECDGAPGKIETIDRIGNRRDNRDDRYDLRPDSDCTVVVPIGNHRPESGVFVKPRMESL